jgi:hypothetical protein
MRLAWRAAGVAAFGATAALAVMLSSHAPTRASLISARDAGGGHNHPRTSAVARCTDAAIDVWLGVGPAGQASQASLAGQASQASQASQADQAGQGYLDLEFTNISGSACELRGYPGVVAGLPGQAAKPAGRILAAVSAVVVKPGQTAHAVADLAPVGCRAAGGLRVGLPADRDTHYALRLCSAPLRVGPVEPGMGIPGT